MKKSIIILIGIVLLTTISLALNINLQVTPTKSTFYDNESVLLDINITNYELSLAAQNAKVVVKINEKNISIPLGNIEPDKTIIKTLDLGKFDAGTYRLETYLEHEFLGITDRTQVQYQNIRVFPSVPIRMKTYSILITDINIPERITVNKEFTIEFDVNSSTDSGFVEFGIAGEKTETEILKEGIRTIKRTYTSDSEGNYLFEIKTYMKQDDVVSLKDYKTRNFVVIDPSKYEEIEYKPIEKRKGNITIEVGKPPERNLIEEVGCFIVGGCKGDMEGPIISNFYGRILDGQILEFSIKVEDISEIKQCNARVKDKIITLKLNERGVYYGQADDVAGDGKVYLDITCVDTFGNANTISEMIFSTELCAFECCVDTMCGEKQYCDNTVHMCVDKKIEGCYSILVNGDQKDKIDITFVGDGFYDKDDLNKAVKYVSGLDIYDAPTGLFSREPFKSNQHKFNLWGILAYDNIRYGESTLFGKSPIIEDGINYGDSCQNTDLIVILSKKDYRSFSAGRPSFNSIGNTLEYGDGTLILHEFGHSFGRLADEYVEDDLGDRPYEPNCAPDRLTAEKWWSNLVGGEIGYYYGCSYTPENIRPMMNSLMRNHWFKDAQYGLVNEKRLLERLGDYK